MNINNKGDNQPFVKFMFSSTMIYQPKTVQEKRAVQFGIDLLTKYDYGHTITVPVMELTKELKEKGAKISHPTVIQYWRALERLGYAKREMQCRLFGVTYRLNRYAFANLISNAQ